MKRHPNEPRCYNFRVVRGPLRLLLALSAFALLVPAAASAYGWPIRPFYQQHLDPRVLQRSAALRRRGPGFHFGVDISAPDGTPVYAIEPGTRPRAHGQTVSVFPKRGGHQLSYWHVVPAVVTGQRVRRHQLIGHVVVGAGHVHLAEYKDGTYINPLRLGGLAPYIDDTVPQIPSLTFLSSGRPIPPEGVTGTVDITAEAFDTPPVPLPLPWNQVIYTPSSDPLADRPGPEHDQAVGDAGRLPDIPPAAQPLQLRLRAGDVPEQGRSARALRVLPRASVRHARAGERLLRPPGRRARRAGEPRPGLVRVHGHERGLSL